MNIHSEKIDADFAKHALKKLCCAGKLRKCADRFSTKTNFVDFLWPARFARKVCVVLLHMCYITYGDRQGSGGAAPEARGLQGLRIWPNLLLFKWKFQVARMRKFSMHSEL